MSTVLLGFFCVYSSAVGQAMPATKLPANGTINDLHQVIRGDSPSKQSISTAEQYKLNPSLVELPPTGSSDQPSQPSAMSQELAKAPTTGPVFQLTAVLNEGLVRSPRVAAARALLGIKTAGYWAATVANNPLFVRDNGLIAEDTIRQGFGFTYDLPWKIVFQLLAAKQQVKETKLEILNTLWQFRADTRRAYVELFVSQAYYQTLAELYDLTKRLQAVSSKLYQAGSVAGLDVLKARLATSQAQIDLEAGEQRVLRARKLLNNMLAHDIDTPISAPPLTVFQLRAEKNELLPDFSESVPPLKDLIEQAYQNRLELRMNAQQIKLAQANLRSAYGNIIPDQPVNVGSSTTGNLGYGPKLNGLFFSFFLPMPFVFNMSQDSITQLRATIRQLKINKYAIMNQIENQVTAAYSSLLQYRGRIQLYQGHVLADSAEVARLARRSYEAGQSDITSTLQAQQANIQVRSQYLDAIASYQQAFTDLEQAVGEPLQ